MVAVHSTMMALGTVAPDFSLLDPRTGGRVSRDAARGPRGLLVSFICNHCPYVVLIRARWLALVHEALDAGIGAVAINSNSVVSHPQDGPQAMAALATAEAWRFPFVFDESQAVAQAYGAACTPDFFLFADDLRLVYRGRLDAATPGNGLAVTGAELGDAVVRLRDGLPPRAEQIPSIGCNIKWNAGNEPSYFPPR